MRARTGQAIVRALTVVLAVEQQRLAGDSEYRYETVPHFSHSALNSAVQLLETNNSTKTASEEKDYERSIDRSWSAHEIGVKPGKEEKKNEEDHDQEPLELVDIYPGTPGYPALPTVLRAPNSKPAYPVSDDGVASPDTLKNAENETRRAPSSPWIKSPLLWIFTQNQNSPKKLRLTRKSNRMTSMMKIYGPWMRTITRTL